MPDDPNLDRGDRIVIDDPHGTLSSAEMDEVRRKWLEWLASLPERIARMDVEPVIIMSRLHGDGI